MADLTKNISNTVRVFGEGPSTKWGQALGVPNTMTWGTSKWGEGLSVVKQIGKAITNSQVVTNALVNFDVRKVFGETITFDGDLTSETLASGNWQYVFTSDTTEAEERDFASWSSGAAGSTSFTCAPAQSTNWT